MDVRVVLGRKLSDEGLMLLNSGVGEESWESLGLQGDPTSPFWGRSALRFPWREWCWSWNSSTLATSCKELTQWKDSVAGRDWGQEEKEMTEDEMAGWHHWLNGCESEWTPGVGDGQGGLACCNSWSCKSRTWLTDWTELNWTGLIITQQISTHINCFMGGGWNTSCHPVSKMIIVREGYGETLTALRYLSYLINSFLTEIKQLAKTSWEVGGRILLLPSDVYVKRFLCPLSL